MTRSREVSARARRLWTRLAEWYGARLAEQFGPEPPSDWCALVDRSSNLDVKRALSTIRIRHPSHPPTLPEFESALRPDRAAAADRDPNAPTVQERLVEHVMSRYRLTAAQRCAHWRFLYARHQWVDSQGRQRDELATCVGVQIPATKDGGSEILVKVDEMDMGLAA